MRHRERGIGRHKEKKSLSDTGIGSIHTERWAPERRNVVSKRLTGVSIERITKKAELGWQERTMARMRKRCLDKTYTEK